MKEPDEDRLRRLIETLKMTRLQVAEYLGVSERTIYRWESKQHRIPRMVFIALELLLQTEV
jgi:transcriptional regulator with XRE-family HTH domain